MTSTAKLRIPMLKSARGVSEHGGGTGRGVGLEGGRHAARNRERSQLCVVARP